MSQRGRLLRPSHRILNRLLTGCRDGHRAGVSGPPEPAVQPGGHLHESAAESRQGSMNYQCIDMFSCAKALQKALTKLTEGGQIVEKTNGKQKIYYIKQVGICQQ
jgi:hypothetical protein